MKKAQYVLVAEDDIPLGRPLPWAIFLRSGELLAPAGYLIADKASQGRLLQAKPMRAARADDAQRTLVDVTDASDGMPKQTSDPLQALKHNVEGIVLEPAGALAIDALLLWAANVYLRHYTIAPVEWLWRSLAEGRRLPFRGVAVEPRAG